MLRGRYTQSSNALTRSMRSTEDGSPGELVTPYVDRVVRELRTPI